MTSKNKQLAFEMRENENLAHLVCLPLEDAGFPNAFSTRLGGVSPFPEKSLHLSFKNDSAQHVRENRRRFLTATKLSGYTIVTAEQTHSSDTSIVDDVALQTLKEKEEYELRGDALISNQKKTLIGVKTADCLPILIGDPETGLTMAIHAGWKGTMERIVEKTLATVTLMYGVQLEKCLAALGPAACAACYEVGSDVADPFKKEFAYADDLLAPSKNPGKFFLDVKLANAMQLLTAGFSPMNIFGADECTMHENALFFSHRREKNTGRLLSVIGKK